MSSRGETVAAAIGALLRRDRRRRIYARLTEGVAEGVNEATYPVLSGLERSGAPATAAEIAALIGIDRSVVSRHATTLERAGLLARSVDERDPRWTALTLTDAGRHAVTVMRNRLAELMEEFLAQWPDDQAAAFVSILEAFAQHGPLTQ